MSTSYFRRGGELATFSKTDGNENKDSKVKPYQQVKIDFDGNEFYCRLTVSRRDFHFRALTTRELRDQIRRTFPDVPAQYEFSRAADLALRGSAAILQGRG
jgi:hypothetical protein